MIGDEQNGRGNAGLFRDGRGTSEGAYPPLAGEGFTEISEPGLNTLAQGFEGEISDSLTARLAYATDASSYREYPFAVAWPASVEDLRALLRFAAKEGLGIIPRTAGTSLAGQVVGSGIVTDLSRHFNRILDVADDGSWVRVQPGVIRDDLNRWLKPLGRYFGPETSTANRAMIGGMVGNNSCGSNSVVYGSTREHVLEIEAVLSDGTVAVFSDLDTDQFQEKLELKGLEGDLYRHVAALFSDASVREGIDLHFPKQSIPRRNTGYALDLLKDAAIWEGSKLFNFSRLICGSEGTLALVTSIKLSTVPLPPAHQALVCAHFDSIDESLRANLVCLQHQPSAVELMDHFVLERTADHPTHSRNRFFVEGNPAAILVAAIAREDEASLRRDCDSLVAALERAGLGYAWPVVSGPDVARVWALRKAGLGLLSNIPGDAKPVPVIEDTAVDVRDLPAYIATFNEILKKHGMTAVHYAHAGSGELHLRPVIDLKTAEGHRQFREIATEVAHLVKEYRGSLSGEHGDGRLRGEFLPLMVGDDNYRHMRELKQIWDPHQLLNPGKIVDTPPMDSSLRFEAGEFTPEFRTGFRWEDTLGLLRAVEQCNGAGECRKSAGSGGVMCPSYMATGEERHTTRARANVLREVLAGKAPSEQGSNPFQHPSIGEVMDSCLSCKGCTAECPSNVDVSRLKTEWQYQRYRDSGFPLRSRIFGAANRLNAMASRVAPLANFFLNGAASGLTKRLMGVAMERSLPAVQGKSLHRRYGKLVGSNSRGKVLLYVDAFTNLLDVGAGEAAIRLLTGLGYQVELVAPAESGRTYLSKGMLDQARSCADRNVSALQSAVSAETPLLGIEPSAIYSFLDEYPDLVSTALKPHSQQIASHTYSVCEFLAKEASAGKISPEDFDSEARNILIHGHCHQKALGSMTDMAAALELPSGHSVSLIPSGCCGMAGSFGYEKEHYELSMKIAELVLFPAVRSADSTTLIVAPGTSCRHQIKDGTSRNALHPVEILARALKAG